jgi:pimeloyl-ACP methyl ester carboxylesterase
VLVEVEQDLDARSVGNQRRGDGLFAGKLTSAILSFPSHPSLLCRGPDGLSSGASAASPGQDMMATIATGDGTEGFYKDWGSKDAQPIIFHHGWPLSSDDWDNQMLTFLGEGCRVIAHDRRGHGRSSQTDSGNEMDTYAADVAELVAALDLKDAIHVGHSTGGGEVARYVARAEPGQVARVVLVGAVPPVRVMHGTDDQLVPFDNHAPKAVSLLKHGTLKAYDGLPHGMAQTHRETINADLLAVFRS